MRPPSAPALAAGIVTLAVGTYALRVAGPLLRERVNLGERPKTLMNTATVVLLTALVATAALLEAGGPAGVARPAGVLAWRRAPFVLVVVAAAVTAAGLRALGVP